MYNDLKYRIKELALSKGLTYQEIGNVCRVDRQTVNNWANLKSNSGAEIKYQALRAMVELFSLETIDELFTHQLEEI